jgi:enoyl-CoA hydratase
MQDSVRIDRQGAVATVILARPEVRNAVDPETATALAEAFIDMENDESVRAVVLWGAGGNFSAGADLRAVAAGWNPDRLKGPTGEAADAFGPMGPTRLRMSKPVIAAISGYAVAGGLELALWCHLRVIEEDAILGVFCRRFGVPLIDGGTVRLPRLIGEARALDLILTGRPVDAREALTIGLATRIVARGESRYEAEALAAGIAAFPERCLRSDLSLARGQWGHPESDALATEFASGLAVLQSGESAAGARRFTGGEGRSGRFS